MLPGGKTLPVCLSEQTAVVYEEETVSVSVSDASRLAFASLTEKIAALIGNGYLVSKSLAVDAREDAFVLTCQLTYVTNIAEVHYFEYQ